jgi:hypothetical protein
VVVSKFSFSHPPTIPWVLTHTVGPITLYHRAWPEITTHTRGPQHARPRQAMARPSLHTGPHPARQWPGPPLALARTRPGPLASTTHSHASTARTGFAGAIRLHLRLLLTHCTQGPKIALARHGPAPLTRITHGPNWGNSLGHVPWLVPYQLAPAAHGTARPARHAHLHDAQPRSHSTHRIRRRNTAPPQVAPDASTQHCTQGPKIALARHGPVPLTRLTHGPNWGNPIRYALH